MDRDSDMAGSIDGGFVKGELPREPQSPQKRNIP